MAEDKPLAARIREVSLMDTDKLDLISSEVAANSKKDINELLRILHSGNKEEAAKASYILLSVEDLPQTPLLDNLNQGDPSDYAWEIETSVTMHLNCRNKVLKIINSMLLDKRIIEGPQLYGNPEEKPPVMRLCDKGYILLRRITSVKEDRESLVQNERIFLQEEFNFRDKEIERIKSSDEWISLSDYFQEESEF
jgi:hypothetical protein